MWKGPHAHLNAAGEGVTGLNDRHAVRSLSKTVQRQLLWPGLLQIAHHPQVVCACSAAHILLIGIRASRSPPGITTPVPTWEGSPASHCSDSTASIHALPCAL